MLLHTLLYYFKIHNLIHISGTLLLKDYHDEHKIYKNIKYLFRGEGVNLPSFPSHLCVPFTVVSQLTIECFIVCLEQCRNQMALTEVHSSFTFTSFLISFLLHSWQLSLQQTA